MLKKRVLNAANFVLKFKRVYKFSYFGKNKQKLADIYNVFRILSRA